MQPCQTLLPVLALGSVGMAVSAAEAQTSMADVFTFQHPDGTPIPLDEREVTGSAELVRNSRGLRIKVKTSLLTPGYTYTIWWIIFNNPRACNEDGCNANDFGDAKVEASVLYATGRVADEAKEGEVTFHAFLPVGLIRLNRTVGGRERHRLGPGLQDTQNAEIHLAIQVPQLPTLA